VDEALAHSSNVAAVHLIHGHVNEVVALARRLGIKGPLEDDDGLALGVSEVTLLELTTAYATVANGGLLVTPYTVSSVEGNMGQVVAQKDEGRRVLSGKLAEVMSAMLEGVVQKGTGVAARPGVWAAGKTGTTTDYRDAWFIGFTRQIVVGVWLGNRKNEPMGKVTGGSLPGNIWRNIVENYHSRPARMAS
jgi:penicillin-binding protein 1A